MSIIESLVNPIDLYPAGQNHDHPATKYSQSVSSFGDGGLTGKSLDSRYSSKTAVSSSLSMYAKRKAKRPTGSVGPVSEVRQRVLSARQHRIRSIQNQLGDAHNHIAELINENRLLSTMQKRQELALAKYENTNAELPQLLHAHAEEIRVWQARVRLLQSQNKELVLKLKHKDHMMLVMADQNKHLQQLNSDKHLEERESLTERVRYLEMCLLEKDDVIKVAARRSHLEMKTAKSQMLIEHGKVRDLQHKLDALSNNGSTTTISTGLFKTKISPTRKISNKLIPISKVANGDNKSKTNTAKINKTSESKTSSVLAKDKTTVNESSPNYNNTDTLSSIDLLLSASETSFTDSQRSHNGAELSTSEYYRSQPDRVAPVKDRLPNLTERSGENADNGVNDDQDDDNDVANGFFAEDAESNYDYDDEPQWDEDVSDDDSSSEKNIDSDNSSISTNVVTYRKRTPSLTTKSTPSDGPTKPKSPLDDLDQMRAEKRVEIMRGEAMLDSLCDSVVKKSNEPRPQLSSTTFNWPTARPSGLPVAIGKRSPLDPNKKLMLQKALRAIDSK